MDGPVRIQLAPGVAFVISGMKLINHPHPLILIGGDLLSGGREKGQVNYTGLKLDTGENGAVTGFICFEKMGTVVEEQLVNVPTARGSHAAGTGSVGMVSGPPLGGQCVRRGSC